MNDPSTPVRGGVLTGFARYGRQRAVPALVWSACVVLLVAVSQQRAQFIEGPGLAQSSAATISPAQDGTLESVAVDLFADVEGGQIVAVMNDAIIQAEFRVAGAELNRLSASLASERARIETDLKTQELDALNDLRRFEMNEEEARVRYLEMVVEQEANVVELERLRIQTDRNRGLLEQNIGSQELYDETRLRYEALKKQVDENNQAIAAAKRLLNQATARRSDRQEQTDQVDIENFLGPIRSEIDVQQARIEEIQERREQLVLRSPISGRVTQLLRGPGETVLAGDPVVFVADSQSHRVVAYLKEDALERVAEGGEALVRSQSRPDVTVRAQVARLGAVIEDLPPAAQRIPLLTERGYPVLIEGIAPGAFVPGERVTVRIRAGGR